MPTARVTFEMLLPLEKNFAPSGFFVLRTPLLPFDDFLAWKEHPHADLSDYLASFFARDVVREGVYLASPTLEARLDAWLADDANGDTSVGSTLGRLFSRITGRPTPFGLFAGITIGQLGTKTRLILAPRSQYRRDTNLDAGFVAELLEGILAVPGVRERVKHRPNPSLYFHGGRFWYVERRRAGGIQTHFVSSIRETSVLRTALERARHGIVLDDLARGLGDDGIPEDIKAAYVRQLADAQVLVTELEPSVTCSDPLARVIQELAAIPEALLLRETLEQTKIWMIQADRSGGSQSPSTYRRLAARLIQLIPTATGRDSFQVDLVKPASEMTLAPLVVKEALRAVELLSRTQPPSNDSALEQFKRRFEMRFEGRPVPLLVALDPDHGVSFGEELPASPLLDGLDFGRQPVPMQEWGPHEVALLRMVERGWEDRSASVELSENEVITLGRGARSVLPDAFAVTFAIAAESTDALDRGAFALRVDGAYGPSGAEFLGRFCLADEQLRSYLGQHLRAEEALRPEAIFAEIVHLPEPRLGTVLRRPILRDFEIPYLGVSEASPSNKIPVEDLVVQIVNDRLTLYSRSLGLEVIPRLSTAHNFSLRSLPVYRFLCALRGQDCVTGLDWSWGPLEASSFLPRITSGRIILSRARWRVTQGQITQTLDAGGLARLTAWRDRLGIPRFVLLIDDDMELPVDLENSASVATLLEWSRTRPDIVIAEMMPAPRNLPARGPEGNFVHEIILPFVRTIRPGGRSTAAVSTKPSAHPANSAAERTFPPGPEWLYVKLYGSARDLDRVLTETVRELVDEFSVRGLIRRWFYIRYMDESYHLRLRLFGGPVDLTKEVLPLLLAAANDELAAGRIWSVVLATYEREVEKYGGAEGIEVAEEIFHAESEAALIVLVSLPEGERGNDRRWQLALLGVDELLRNLGYNLADRRRLITVLQHGLQEDFGIGSRERQKIGRKFRDHRQDLEALLKHSRISVDRNSALASERGVARLPLLADKLRSLERSGRLTRTVDDIVLEFVHLRVNRILIAPNPREELILYEYLRRLYDSELARKNS